MAQGTDEDIVFYQHLLLEVRDAPARFLRGGGAAQNLSGQVAENQSSRAFAEAGPVSRTPQAQLIM